jgi:hypothetical protein
VTKLKGDLNKALDLLKDNDPLFTHSFSALNGNYSGLDDNYLLFRQSRLNYYAVKALQARICLYLGDRPGAYAAAKELIETEEGAPILNMSGRGDLVGSLDLADAESDEPFYALPSECLFYLSKYNIKSSTTFLLAGGSVLFNRDTHLGLTSEMREELYDGQYISTHNRYLKTWRSVEANAGSGTYYVTMKYWHKDNAKNPIVKRQIIPMIRMSEIYLIAIETSDDLAEVNALYKAYMTEHEVMLVSDQFTSLADVQAEVLNEYRREFFAEGQMFYAYKRVGATQMLWRDAAVEESEYVLPLPETEYNPNTLNQ